MLISNIINLLIIRLSVYSILILIFMTIIAIIIIIIIITIIIMITKYRSKWQYPDVLRQHKTRQVKSSQVKSSQVKSSQVKSRQVKTNQDKTRQDKTKRDKTKRRIEQDKLRSSPLCEGIGLKNFFPSLSMQHPQPHTLPVVPTVMVCASPHATPIIVSSASTKPYERRKWVNRLVNVGDREISK